VSPQLPNFRKELISLLKDARTRDDYALSDGDVAHEIAAIYELEAHTLVSRSLESDWKGRTRDGNDIEVDIQTAKDRFELQVKGALKDRHLILARLSSSSRVTTYEIVFEGPLSMIAGTSNKEIKLSPEEARSLNVSVPPDKRLIFRRAR